MKAQLEKNTDLLFDIWKHLPETEDFKKLEFIIDEMISENKRVINAAPQDKVINVNIGSLVDRLEVHGDNITEIKSEVATALLNVVQCAGDAINNTIKVDLEKIFKNVCVKAKQPAPKLLDEKEIEVQAHKILSTLNGFVVGDIQRILEWAESVALNSTTFKNQSNERA